MRPTDSNHRKNSDNDGISSHTEVSGAVNGNKDKEETATHMTEQPSVITVPQMTTRRKSVPSRGGHGCIRQIQSSIMTSMEQALFLSTMSQVTMQRPTIHNGEGHIHCMATRQTLQTPLQYGPGDSADTTCTNPQHAEEAL